MMPALDANLDALNKATTQVRAESRDDGDRRTVQRFFHLLLMECAERMTVAEFRKSIEVAREQLRKPIA